MYDYGRRRRVEKKADDVYAYCCQLITMREQKLIFGTIGLKNILKTRTKGEAIERVKDYLYQRDELGLTK